MLTIRNIWHNSTADFSLRFAKLPAKFANIVTPTYRRKYETFSALQRTDIPLTDVAKAVEIDS